MKTQITLALVFLLTAPALAQNADERSFYKEQSPTTSPGKHADLYRDLPRDPGALVKVVQGLITHGALGWMYKHQPTTQQFEGFTAARTGEQILDNILRLDPAPLTTARPIDRRAVGNCRTFSVLMVSMLRHQGVSARMRVGYSTYTWGDPNLENHFIVEYFNGQRWVLLDAQMDQTQRDFHKIDFDTLDLPKGKFIFAGQAWAGLNDGSIAPARIGMGGSKGWESQGYRFVQVDVLADCWALNKVELFTGESNDFARTPHENLSADQLKLFDRLARQSASSTRDSKLDSEPIVRIDPANWKP